MDEKIERLPAPAVTPSTDTEVEHTNTLGWKGPQESREPVGEHDGKPVEVGELHIDGTSVGRTVYLGGERIGRLHGENGGWRAESDRHGSVGSGWYVRTQEGDDPTARGALHMASVQETGEDGPETHFSTGSAVSQEEAERRLAEHIDPRTGERVPRADAPRTASDDEDEEAPPGPNAEEPDQEPDNAPEVQVPDLPGLDLSEYTARDERAADAYRSWAGVWANPAPDGPRNALLDRVANMPGSAYRPLHPENASRWISIAGDVAPFAQFDENARHLLSQYDGEQADFLAGRAASLREAAQRIAENFRADGRKIMLKNIATREGTKKATAKLEELWSDALERIRQVVPDQVAAALADAERHGLSEQQLKDFLGGIGGGDDLIRMRTVSAALPGGPAYPPLARTDVLAYFTGFPRLERLRRSGV
ncbi:hypothetical protein HFP70_35085 [Streptomyces sp. ARC14]|uniref:hypothetical protein n=1 Tax=Streptomyces sp. ARC14 TaxID=2724152 RepID=UPI0038575259